MNSAGDRIQGRPLSRLRRTVMDDSQIELLTKEEGLLEEEVKQLQDAGLNAQVAGKKRIWMKSVPILRNNIEKVGED